ncbi:alpha/beta fold hydrolase [Patulibacter defluvii]|uniref:alpha/beta fold hydrolase n=1 Tax=Patulibacter defluvii TaxID=3095358 RepID=UPI002A7490D2|nr:alpha/beta fold hydrolase [Patulibacter sp. DM4]
MSTREPLAPAPPVADEPEERFCTVGDVEICFSTFGDPDAPPLLLVMGLGFQMIAWPAAFCHALAAAGFHVIRFDNRDAGRSTHLSGAPTPSLRELALRRIAAPAYTLETMADDAIGVLDHLGVEQAHVVGASMGGMIAQTIAIRRPQRVRSLVSIMSNTGSSRDGQPHPTLLPLLLAKPARDRDAYVASGLRVGARTASPGFPSGVDELRTMLGRNWDRGVEPAGVARQLGAIIASGSRRERLAGLRTPTLVVHGTADRLVAPSGGRATARAIPGADLLLVAGMGHDLPAGVWPRLVSAIAANAGRADG